MVIEKFKFRFLIFLMFCSSELSSCTWGSKNEWLSRPSIQAVREWRLEEGCGYERCGGPPVDFLVGKGLTIRVQRSQNPQLFLVIVGFVLKKDMAVEITPSLTRIELANGRSLQAKSYHCSGRLFDTDYKIGIPPIGSTTVLSGDKDCLYFVFEPPPPNVHDEFKLFIPRVSLNGQIIEIPEIIFKAKLTRY
jgi:hypothetical protein